MENLDKLVNELRKYKDETSWLEFKHNNFNPEMIGADISALANGAALSEKNFAYMLWGIKDDTHDIEGTSFNLQNLKKGNQEIENWLRSLLSNNADFSFDSVEMPEGRVGILKIAKAVNQPVTFRKTGFIRIGSYTKKLNDYPSVEARLWDKLRSERFEERYARENLNLEDALALLDYSTYFGIIGTPQPSSADGIAHYMLEEHFIMRQDNGLYSITNLGCILLSRRLAEFDRLSRKAVRIVQYADNGRLNMQKEEVGTKGYAAGFESLVKYLEALLPSREVINGALRERKSAFPPVAIREIVANSLIHQDFSISGAGPVVEIFSNRIEVTNPGTPLIDIKRIIDNPPKSRNEKLAEVMRRLRMCEELGTGWDKIVIACELQQLPAPKIEIFAESTKVTLYARENFAALSLADKLWACYLHACIKRVQGEYLTNSSLRDRFGLKETSSGTVSRLIKEAVKANLIKPLDPDTAPRYMKYIPAWA